MVGKNLIVRWEPYLYMPSSILPISLNYPLQLYTWPNSGSWDSCLAVFFTHLQTPHSISPLVLSAQLRIHLNSDLQQALVSAITFYVFVRSFIPQTFTECQLMGHAGNMLKLQCGPALLVPLIYRLSQSDLSKPVSHHSAENPLAPRYFYKILVHYCSFLILFFGGSGA
jgi:hypothetical protein